MDDASREALLWGGSQMSASTTWNFHTDDSKAIEHARGKGINIVQGDAELLAAVKEFATADLKTVSALFKDTYGVERASEIAAGFVPLLAKWNGLVTDVDSKEGLQQLYWNEVISKVDPSTYGMN